MVTKTAAAVSTNSVNITNNAEAVAAFRAYVEAKATIKAAEDAKKAAEATLRAVMGDAQDMILRGVTVLKISDPRTRTGFDAKILRELFPEAAAAAATSTTYTQINVL